jgi:hypothetical protein
LRYVGVFVREKVWLEIASAIREEGDRVKKAYNIQNRTKV